MKAEIIQTIDCLKAKIKNNLTVIQNNQKAIRHLLKEPESEEKAAELEEKYALNKILLNENNDFINVQLTLTSFLEKYKESDIVTGECVQLKINKINEEECFELTVNGRMTYNSKHPFYDNDQFFQRLLDYYQRIEDYENCSKLVLAKNQE